MALHMALLVCNNKPCTIRRLPMSNSQVAFTQGHPPLETSVAWLLMRSDFCALNNKLRGNH